LHWPYPPDPAEYHSPQLALLVAVFAMVLIFLVAVLWAAKSSAPRLHDLEQEADRTRPEEKERDTMTE